MRILLIPMGSHGDVHPFVGLGTELRRRGHDVTIVANEHFKNMIQAAHLNMIQLGDDAFYRQVMQNPLLWDPWRAHQLVAQLALDAVPELHKIVVDFHQEGPCKVVGSSLAIGARIAQETHQVPYATVHLQPIALPSKFSLGRTATINLPSWAPMWLKKGAIRLVHKMMDSVFCPRVNEFRATFNLPPMKRTINWWNSPNLILGMWPDWFGPVQPDWPEQIRVVGFPMFDESAHTPPAPDVEAYLADGPPPVVFTPGSAMVQGQDFFAAALDGCGRIGRRAMLLTRFPEQIPGYPTLPAHARHFSYVPLSQILPRCAAIVHHGGMGTMSQGLAAGIPHLFMPMSHDQPDNAFRIKNLGCAEVLPRRKFTAPRVAKALDKLLNDPNVALNCRDIKKRFEGMNAIGKSCDLIETL